ncbi:serine hydrolase [Paenibacillus macerans]|uniref:serine hydrolase n=1 Tax=Paenibacillus macerans TaxID=44252 RepID=UPI00204148AE|nr:serine hydrolase [Paenibacillus macerans]MCM3700880.1 class A beta-lactamase-related serine hydrolase [Paenibacillus macerans]
MIILMIVVAVLVLMAVSFGLMVFYAKRKDERKTETDVLQFLEAHPELASMYVMENDRVVIDFQSDVKRPLASVLKIAVAIELAEQAAEARIDVNEAVPLDSLRRFYIPGTDGGAHPSWLDALDPAVTADGTVTLLEAAKGMIHYSSNANTEYLMERLGLDNINARIQKLGLSRHDPIFPVSAAMLMYGYMTKYEHMSRGQAEQAMKGLTDREYAAKAQLIFDWIRQNPEAVSSLHDRSNPIPVQRIWSSRLPGATVKEYAVLLQNIQKGESLSPEATRIVKEIMERKPKPESKYITIGSKGGSSLSILNQTLYCEDKQGNQIQLALFIHEPQGLEIIWLEKKLDLFLQKYLTDDHFKQQVILTLGGTG